VHYELASALYIPLSGLSNFLVFLSCTLKWWPHMFAICSHLTAIDPFSRAIDVRLLNHENVLYNSTKADEEGVYPIFYPWLHA